MDSPSLPKSINYIEKINKVKDNVINEKEEML